MSSKRLARAVVGLALAAAAVPGCASVLGFEEPVRRQDTGGATAEAGGATAGAGGGGSSGAPVAGATEGGSAGGETTDACAASPCEHDGVCSAVGDGASCACAGPWTGDRCEKPLFQALDMPAGGTDSTAISTNADGSVVVGEVTIAEIRGFVWDVPTERMIELPPILQGTWCSARGVNDDGTIIVGTSDTDGRVHAARWLWRDHTSRDIAAADDLESGSGASWGNALRVCADGSVAVGLSASRGARWTLGKMAVLGDILADVSGDCSVVVGKQGSLAWLWGPVNDMAISTDIVGSEFSGKPTSMSADATNRDGTVIVGDAQFSGGGLVFRWTAATGPRHLGFVPDSVGNPHPTGLSADGTIAVGGSPAWVWDSVHGMRSLTQILTQHGVDLEGMTLDDAGNISRDGKVIVGSTTLKDGTHRAWLARLPQE